MKTRRRKTNFSSVPQKPELEMTNSGVPGEDDEEEESVAVNIPETERIEKDSTSLDIPEGNTFTAPVNMPDRQMLARDLVPSDLIYQYYEHEADEGKMSSMLFLFVGAFIGIIINWITSSPIVITIASVIVQVIFLTMISFTGFFTYTFHQRAKNKKTEIDKYIKRKE